MAKRTSQKLLLSQGSPLYMASFNTLDDFLIKIQISSTIGFLLNYWLQSTIVFKERKNLRTDSSLQFNYITL